MAKCLAVGTRNYLSLYFYQQSALRLEKISQFEKDERVAGQAATASAWKIIYKCNKSLIFIRFQPETRVISQEITLSYQIFHPKAKG